MFTRIGMYNDGEGDSMKTDEFVRKWEILNKLFDDAKEQLANQVEIEIGLKFSESERLLIKSLEDRFVGFFNNREEILKRRIKNAIYEELKNENKLFDKLYNDDELCDTVKSYIDTLVKQQITYLLRKKGLRNRIKCYMEEVLDDVLVKMDEKEKVLAGQLRRKRGIKC